MKRIFGQMAGRKQTDEAIVDAIRSGVDGRVNGAIQQLYHYKTYVTNFVWNDPQRELLRFDEHYVNDLFQETIITFLKKVWSDDYQLSAQAELKTYLFSISHNKYRSERKQALQRLGRAHEYALQDEEPITAEEVYIEHERHSLVEQLLDRLDKFGGVAGGELIRLFDFQFKSHAEIALIYGISEGAAKQRYHRARQQLNTILDDFDGTSY